MLTPSRLSLARKRRGLTAAELARKTGVSATSIGDYERGRRQPSAATVATLSAALGFPAAFLAAPDLAELPEQAVAFRAPTKLPALRRASVTSVCQLAIEFSSWMDKNFTLPPSLLPTLEHPDPQTAAEMVRARWAMRTGAAPNMVQLLEAHGVRVFSLPVDCTDVGAFSFWHGKTPFVFLNPTTSPERGRFDAAHELGHLVLHRNMSSPDAESEANAFAGAFLMPRNGMVASVANGPVTEQVLGHRTYWHVSGLALTYRLRDLGLVTQEQYGALCAELSRTGEPEGMTRRESSHLLNKVFRTLRESGRTPHQVAQELLLDVDELNSLVFGLVLTALPGEGEQTPPARPKLTVVR